MKELQELRDEILTLRNYGVINKEEEKSLLTKLNSVKYIPEHNYNDLVDKINDLFSLHVVMHWVVCKEELPKEDGYYLINWEGTVIEAGYSVEQNIWRDYPVSEYKDVTHWMQLPKPPCA